MEEYLQMGVIASTHGLKGEVKVFPTTDDKEHFKAVKHLYLNLNGEKKRLEITGVKYINKFVVLKFKEFNRIEEVEGLRSQPLLVRREEAAPLGDDEYFVADLIGLSVYTEEEKLLGTLDDVLSTGANDVYLVKTEEGSEILLPAIRECIKRVDMESRKMWVYLMPGLV